MAEPVHADESFNPHARGHQEDRVSIRSILLFGLGLVAVVVVIFVVLAAMMGRFATLDQRREARRPDLFANEQGLYPGPRLQRAPDLDMRQMRREVRERLDSYGWVDREAGIAHIPIDRAIEITARELSNRGGARE